ncbi:YraN family protein [bacterium]|nr:YraN family protein [bacterium]
MNLLRSLLKKIKLSIFLKKRDRKDAGKIGENIAVKFLTRKGYSILEQNFRVKGGEIDIIASKDNTLVFVEVKSRTSTEYGTGEEAVTYTKRKKLILAAKIYLKYKGEDYNCRFDVIAILFDKTKKAKEINHIEGAFTL